MFHYRVSKVTHVAVVETVSFPTIWHHHHPPIAVFSMFLLIYQHATSQASYLEGLLMKPASHFWFTSKIQRQISCYWHHINPPNILLKAKKNLNCCLLGSNSMTQGVWIKGRQGLLLSSIFRLLVAWYGCIISISWPCYFLYDNSMMKPPTLMVYKQLTCSYMPCK